MCVHKITDSFGKSLVVDSKDLIEDYTEIGIDLLIKNDILKDIPVIKTIIGGARTIKNVRERNFIKNLIQFINEINSGSVNKEKLIDYQNNILDNPKKAEKELGRVLLILDENIDNEKNVMIGKLFKSYINGYLQWDEFCELTEVVRRLFVQDISLLLGIYHGGLKKTKIAKEMYRIDRIRSLGVTGVSEKALFAPVKELDDNLYLIPNKIGKKFMNIVFESDVSKKNN